MDHIKRAVLQELRFTFKDCDDNLDLILNKWYNYLVRNTSFKAYYLL